MVYKIYCDNTLLYHSNLENLKILGASVELELNKTGSFDLHLHKDHPYYSQIQRMKSIIRVYQDDYLLFRGRALDEKIGWHNDRFISCEGDMAFLLDSVLRPFSFSGTPAEVLAYVLELHNAQVDESKRFALGNVTVEGYVTIDREDYTTTKETLEKGLVEPLGGYLMTRYVDGVAYLDYLSEITLLSPQKIEFGKNLLDLSRIRKGADIATVLIPLGAKIKDEEGNDTGKRLTIESVNGGADFIQDEAAVSQYGVIVKSVIFDDIADAMELKLKGQAQLADYVNQWETIDLSAADLSTVGLDVASFHLATQVQVLSRPHALDQRFVVSKLKIDLLNPIANKLTLGKTIAAFSEAVTGISKGQGAILQAMEKTAQQASEAVYNVEQNLQASINTAADNITASVAEKYTLKEDADALVSEISTELTLTKNSFDVQFTQFNQDIEALANGTDAEFEEIKKYIRFVDGKILLGEVGNELELQIGNDRISFLQDGAEVAYFSDRKLFVTDAQFLHSLQLGNFAFMPRANGNLSFKRNT